MMTFPCGGDYCVLCPPVSLRDIPDEKIIKLPPQKQKNRRRYHTGEARYTRFAGETCDTGRSPWHACFTKSGRVVK
jgi:hypothetical protein